MQIVIKYADKKIDSYILEQFNKEVVSFGRQPDNDIVLDWNFVSRIHGVFFMEDGTWYVQDLGSTNGLLVNGVYIDQPYAIKEGDCICIQRKDGEESISIYILSLIHISIINRKKRTIPIASIEYVESRGRKIVLHLGCGEMTFYSKISEDVYKRQALYRGITVGNDC